MFPILKECSSKFDCLLYEMFLIREHKSCLNIQSENSSPSLKGLELEHEHLIFL